MARAKKTTAKKTTVKKRGRPTKKTAVKKRATKKRTVKRAPKIAPPTGLFYIVKADTKGDIIKGYFDGVRFSGDIDNAILAKKERAIYIARKLGEMTNAPIGIIEMVKKKITANPVPKSTKARDQLRTATRLYEDFTGHEADYIYDVETPDNRVFMEMGKVDAILYTTKRDGETEHYIHEFKDSAKPTLAAAPDELRIVNGKFHVTERGIVDKA